MGERDETGPRGVLAHPVDDLRRHADRRGHEVLDGILAAAGRQQLVQVLDVFGGLERPTVVDDERRLVEREPRDRETRRGRAQGEHGARGMAEHERRPTRLLDQRRDVLDLPLDGVRLGVAALAAAAPVERDRR